MPSAQAGAAQAAKVVFGPPVVAAKPCTVGSAAMLATSAAPATSVGIVRRSPMAFLFVDGREVIN
ncbi:hypothetical protein ACVCAH_12460 [Micromonospora sp. LZ34]